MLSNNVKKVVINNRMSAYGRAHGDGTMEVNLKMGDVVNTIIHENLHMKDWQMPHGQVYKNSDKIEGNMSLRKMGELLLETHDRMLNPQHGREITHTQASKVAITNAKKPNYGR